MGRKKCRRRRSRRGLGRVGAWETDLDCRQTTCIHPRRTPHSSRRIAHRIEPRIGSNRTESNRIETRLNKSRQVQWSFHRGGRGSDDKCEYLAWRLHERISTQAGRQAGGQASRQAGIAGSFLFFLDAVEESWDKVDGTAISYAKLAMSMFKFTSKSETESNS